MKSLIRFVPAAFLLVACGDTITEQISVSSVTSSDELPKCTKDIAGQTAFVTETREFLGCDGKEWLTLSANTVSVGDNICTSTSLSDGTGFEIFCNGESIGTVKNGKDGKDGADGEDGADGADGRDGKDGKDGKKGDPGADGKDGEKGDQGNPGVDGKDGENGSGCSIQESTALTATIACGSETFTMDLTGYVEQSAECDTTLYAEDCTGSLDNVSLGGVSQKGPFVIGTDITAYELENGRSLKQTGKTFGGKIERADGTFDIKTVKLKSSFAYLVADGFYRNEVTGENSATTIKLRALTNLQGRSSANVNLVTHLEYDRVQRLVTKEDSTVMKAKKAAEREIFAEFGIDNSGFKGYAEDFNILKEGDGNAALLAISALLQGDRNESELTALLASLSVDLGDNGKWDNKQQRAQIADWALMKEFSKEGLASIRKNVEGWDLGMGKAPAFEGHMTHFWMKELGVDECSSENEGALFAIKNTKSAFYAAQDSVFTEGDSSLARLICDADGAWRFATEIEKDTAALAPAGDGAAALGKINTGFVYVKEGPWRRGTDLDKELDFSCIDDVLNYTTFTADATDTTWYICVADGSKLDGYTIPRSWRLAKEAEADTAQFGIPTTAKDSIKQGHVNKGRFFVYEENGWRRGTENDYLLGKACLDGMANKVYYINEQYYTCTREKKIQSDGVTVSNTWRASTAEEADYYFAENPDQEGAVMQGDMDKSRIYVYEDNKWRRGTNLDWTLREGCIGNKVGTVKLHGDKYYTCTAEEAVENGIEIANTWRLSNADEADTLGWAVPTTTKDSVKTGNVDKTRYYVYEGGWRFGTYLDEDLGPCTSKKLNKVVKSSAGVWYKCISGGSTLVDGKPVAREWRKATDFEVDTYSLSATVAVGKYSEGPVNKNLHYVKDSAGWRPATDLENSGLKACTKTQKDSVKSTNAGDWYKCTNDLGTTIDGFVVNYTWRKATNIEKDTVGWGRKDAAEGDFKTGEVNGNLVYVFEIKNGNGAWRHGTSLDASLGLSCIPSRKDTLLEVSSVEWYKCVGDTNVSYEESNWTSVWRRATDLEIDMVYWNKNNKENGTLLKGSFTGRTMVWDGGALREANDVEIGWNKGCVNAKYGKTDTLWNGLEYTCSSTGWSKTGTFTDGRDQKIYKGVTIGTQTWMAENLNFRMTRKTRDNGLDSSSFCYNNDPANCQKSGRLYIWSAVMDSTGIYWPNTKNKCGYDTTCTISPQPPVRGVCPENWHVPAFSEFETLVNAVGGSYYAAKMLKSTSGWYNNMNGTDDYSFSAIPAGYSDDGISYSGDRILGLWTINENERYSAYYLRMEAYYNYTSFYSANKYMAYSVRCVKNDL